MAAGSSKDSSVRIQETDANGIILRKAIELKVKKILSEVDLNKFKELFGPACEGQKVNMEKLHTILENKILSQVMSNVDDMMKSDEWEPKRAKLKQIIDASGGDKQARQCWRPTGKTVKEQLCTRDMIHILQYKKDLETAVKEAESRERHLFQKVSSMRSRACKLWQRIEAIDGKVENIEELEILVDNIEKKYCDDFNASSDEN